jgi:DNA ligase-1
MIESMRPGSFERMAKLILDMMVQPSAGRMEMLRIFLGSLDEKDLERAIQLFTGNRPGKIITRARLKSLHRPYCPFPSWLQDECHAVATDPCEAIALLEQAHENGPSAIALETICLLLVQQAKEKDHQRAAFIQDQWSGLSADGIQFFNRLITGEWKPGPWQDDLIMALSSLWNMAPSRVAYGLTRQDIQGMDLKALLHPDRDIHVQPLAFTRLTTLSDGPGAGLLIEGCHARFEPPGIQVQLVRRNGMAIFWEGDHHPWTGAGPALVEAALAMPDGTVIEGTVSSGSTPVARGNRSGAGSRKLEEPIEVKWTCTDILEWHGESTRHLAFTERLQLLAECLEGTPVESFTMNSSLPFRGRSELDGFHAASRAQGATGIRLVPDKGQGQHFFWPASPLSIDAVLLYVQRPDGTGIQYSFALRNGSELVTIARTNAGLTDAERSALELFIKKNTLQRFGPVRTVKAEQVFRLSFGSIKASTRHKSGFMLEGVRIVEWRKGASWEDIGRMEDLRAMAEL